MFKKIFKLETILLCLGIAFGLFTAHLLNVAWPLIFGKL